MKMLQPIALTDAQLVSHSVPEADHPQWASGTTYALGARVIVLATHRIYESAQANNLGRDPRTAGPAWWIDIGPTNRWAMFDQAVGSVTTGTSPIVVTLRPAESFNALALLDLVGTSSVRVQVVHASTTLYDRTFNMLDNRITAGGWWEFFFLPLAPQTALVVEDLPPVGDITVTIHGAGCGTLIYGRSVALGSTLAQPRIGIVDYSTRQTDTFGVTTVVRRSFARRFEVEVLTPAAQVDALAQTLAAVRAIPVLWMADSAGQYAALLVYGFYKDWNVTIEYPTHSLCNLVVEGLT